ncbi:Ig-like domain-containing protein, partial [Gordoniibacillus kamchatkensis]|uniref:Ig-like domain-containing protein n=1 Tax=Gordoniibacillus kamchatkensis TaxID=1590651 RepID=UPI0012E05063
MGKKSRKFTSILFVILISFSLLSVLLLLWPEQVSAATPASEDFQSSFVDPASYDPLAAELSIPRRWGDWTYSILDSSGNVETNANPNGPFIHITDRFDSFHALPVSPNKALYIFGGLMGIDTAAKISSSDSGAFKLISFEAETGNEFYPDSANYRVIGYLNGSPVSGASYDFTAPAGSITTVNLTNSSWGNINEFRIVQQNEADISIIIDNITVTDPATNTVPTFIGSTSALTVYQDASATDVKGLLHVSDTDSGQTETWTQSIAPSHGTLSISGATAASGSTDIAPGGTITYKPTAGYSGSDSFTIQVTDGNGGTATRTITITIIPQAAAPTANPASGATVANNSSVTLSTATSGAMIYYTTDGTTPTTSS